MNLRIGSAIWHLLAGKNITKSYSALWRCLSAIIRPYYNANQAQLMRCGLVQYVDRYYLSLPGMVFTHNGKSLANRWTSWGHRLDFAKLDERRGRFWGAENHIVLTVISLISFSPLPWSGCGQSTKNRSLQSTTTKYATASLRWLGIRFADRYFCRV